jgi:hypothetical protein
LLKKDAVRIEKMGSAGEEGIKDLKLISLYLCNRTIQRPPDLAKNLA